MIYDKVIYVKWYVVNLLLLLFFLCQLDQTHLKFGCVNMDNTMGIISTKKNSDSPVNKKYFL